MQGGLVENRIFDRCAGQLKIMNKKHNSQESIRLKNGRTVKIVTSGDSEQSRSMFKKLNDNHRGKGVVAMPKKLLTRETVEGGADAGHGSSHKGGHYRNPNTDNQYGRHK
jgi:hypothetical protein